MSNRHTIPPLPPQITNLLDALNRVDDSKSRTLKKERVRKNLELYTTALNTFLVYPDILMDIMTPKYSSFKPFFSQRVSLRIMARMRQSFSTFTRAYSKSFLAFYDGYVASMIVPRRHSFVTAGTKTQAAQIAKEKVIMDLWVKFPLLKNEMQKRSSKSAFVEGKDYAEFRFTHGGIFDVVGGHPRGMRRHKGVFEETIELNPTVINEEIIPLMNAPRTTIKGVVNPYEPHAQKTYVTTAGEIDSFAYSKCIETLCYSVLEPQHYCCIGGSYIIPLMHGRLEQQQMREVLSSPSFDKDSADREYRSIWTGSKSGIIFGGKTIATMRKIHRAEYRAAKELGDDFYVIAADMAKDGSADTALVVLRVSPSKYMFNFKLINLFTIQSTDFEVVSNEIKKTIMRYDAKLCVIDATGIGAAIRDWLNKPSVDRGGMLLPGFGIMNAPKSAKKDIITYPKERTIIYEIKASRSENEKMHQLLMARVSNGSIRMLIKTSEILAKLQTVKSFAEMSHRKQRERLSPYRFTDMMELQLKNLIISDTSDLQSNTLRVNRVNTQIQKDFFSALEYGVYATHLEFELAYYKKMRTGSKNKWAGAVLID